jgi:hypothetical protein
MNFMKLRRLFFLAALTALCANRAVAQSDAPAPARESIEWCDVWISHANETNLPRVLLIGDSITRDYYPQVEKLLAGKAYVGRLTSSAFISDPALAQQITMMLSQYKFDIIQFNNGMHGWPHSEKEYEEAFPEFLATIRDHAPNAKLIWANTTSLKISPNDPPGDQPQATDERIAARNDIATKFAKAGGIDVNDLFSLGKGHPEYHTDNVHFNELGIALQASQVADHIEKLLSEKLLTKQSGS